MQSLLVKIASFAVMVHMTFGCSMHHGLGNNACAHQHETACEHVADHGEDHEHGHGDHVDDGHESKLPSSVPVAESSHDFNHFDCCDDGCNLTQSVSFAFQSLDFSVPYLGGADTLALVERQTLGGFYSGEPVADDAFPRGSVRAHLLFGVQIL